jgi:hypothetical protein
MSSPEDMEVVVRQTILNTAGEADPFSLLADGQNPFYEPVAEAANLDVERDKKSFRFM